MGNPSIFDVLCKVAFLTLLASPFQCDAASGKVRVDNVKVDILSKQGAVLETFQYQNEIPNIDVRGSAIVKVRRSSWSKRQLITLDTPTIAVDGSSHDLVLIYV